ncbi:general secretion pathway protein F [Variovorax boronicumulans]|uniref:General secretion pathway protein F n=1 Tax=Variovorax boronicumulans TaxID=436515 RepID=A0AAW8DRH7_9BURK|nr:type II secretion system F family protein [Variovorax boronicumulans]MDP9877266.1 general secretion pathway protein F [Variovorax boronicumulans]MDP9921857.1 general secretion pathway protein F [Variovorax boronicumulans]
MATFKVRGLTAQGELQLRLITAGSRVEAEQSARQGGLRVLDVQGDGFRRPMLFASTAGGFDLALFAQELVALLSAGLSLIETLETLAERQEGASRGSSVLNDLVRRMQEGQAFSSALKTFPAIFPELFIASVAASEHTGEMVPALQRYLRYHEQLGVIRQKIISASLYPAMLCAVGAAVALFLLCFLVPRFSRVYEGMEDRLPLASRWLMHWGIFASEHWVLIAFVLIAIAMALPVMLTRPHARAWMGTTLQANRWIGGRVKLMQLSRFYRSLGLLLGGGIPVTRAMHMAQGLLPVRLQPAAMSATLEVTQGRSLSDSLQTAALTTPVALRLLRAGERNGQMAEMLEQAASFHDKEIAHWIDRFAKLFEPVLMLVIGLAIGGIVIMLYLPIFELAGSLG